MRYSLSDRKICLQSLRDFCRGTDGLAGGRVSICSVILPSRYSAARDLPPLEGELVEGGWATG
jgi:hypothetical protein